MYLNSFYFYLHLVYVSDRDTARSCGVNVISLRKKTKVKFLRYVTENTIENRTHKPKPVFAYSRHRQLHLYLCLYLYLCERSHSRTGCALSDACVQVFRVYIYIYILSCMCLYLKLITGAPQASDTDTFVHGVYLRPHARQTFWATHLTLT